MANQLATINTEFSQIDALVIAKHFNMHSSVILISTYLATPYAPKVFSME